MHNEKQKKETRGRKFIADPMERMETFRVGLKKGTIEKWGGVCHLRELIKQQLENEKFRIMEQGRKNQSKVHKES